MSGGWFIRHACVRALTRCSSSTPAESRCMCPSAATCSTGECAHLNLQWHCSLIRPRHCFEQLVATGHMYTCPTCNKAMCNLTKLYGRMDAEIAQTPMVRLMPVLCLPRGPMRYHTARGVRRAAGGGAVQRVWGQVCRAFPRDWCQGALHALLASSLQLLSSHTVHGL